MAGEVRPDLLDLEPEELERWVTQRGEPAYRARQILNWLYQHGADRFAAMTNLPRAWRERLEAEARIGAPAVVRRQISADGTRKLLLQLDDGALVEAVLIPDGDRFTACISSQAGCAMGCAFCATALGGLQRNLRTGEIVGQLLRLNADLAESGQRVTHIVFMGMGEPLANYERVVRAVRLIHHPLALGMSQRRITVSTVGLVPGIRRLAEERLQITLAISLHAPNDELRNRLVPINRRYPLAELLAAAREYVEKTHRRVTFEYVLLKGINDSPAEARQLAGLAQSLLCHVNLIPFNPVPESGFERPGEGEIRRFQEILQGYGVPVTVRRQRGADIDAACGQLRRAAEVGFAGAGPGRSLVAAPVRAGVQLA